MTGVQTCALPISQPVDDLSDPGALALALGRAQRGIGGEEDGIAQLNGGTLPVMRERDDVALGATEGVTVAHRGLDQLVGLGDPEQNGRASCRGRGCQYV